MKLTTVIVPNKMTMNKDSQIVFASIFIILLFI